MKPLILGAILVSSLTPGFSTEMCPLKKLEKVQVNHPECLFYRGTDAFRNNDYPKAAQFWSALIAQQPKTAEYRSLKNMAYNNLGYLYFTGKGVAEDKKTAIEFWKTAAKADEDEAYYHLCHVYGDANESTYAPATATGFCKEALRRYKASKETSPSVQAILGQIERYLDKLEPKRDQHIIQPLPD